ncbi:MAG: protein kinase domain-containing protein [Acidimicrobiales bacterium]
MGDFIDLGIEGIEEATAIGAGGAAMVYRARQPRLNRTVAVKVIQAVGDDASTRRFAREASALGQLSEHPGIVTVYDAGTTAAGQPYLIMQYCDAGSLQDELHRSGPLPVDEAVRVAGSVADALRRAHELGIMHRDLKPANVLIGNGGRHLVADFGIAALADSSAVVSTAVSFTPGYAPPETIQGDPATPASDVYSLGATLYALVTSDHPFAEDGESNIYTLIHRILNDQLDDTRQHGVPDAVASIIEDCTAKDPARRPSMDELVDRLRSVDATAVSTASSGAATFVAPDPVTGDTVITSEAPPTTTETPATTDSPVAEYHSDTDPSRPRRWWLVALVMGVVAAAAVVGVLATRDSDTGTAADQPGPTTSVVDPSVTPVDEVTVVESVTVGGAPQDPLLIDGSMWVSNRSEGIVLVTDFENPSDPTVVDVGTGPLRPIVGEGLIWVANDDDGTVSVIDPETKMVTATVAVGDRPRPPATVNGRMWVPTLDGVAVIDPEAMEVSAEVTGLGARPQAPLVAGNLVWVPDAGGDTVSVIDPPTQAVIQTLPVGARPLQPVAVNNQVWVPSEDDGNITVIDPESREVLATIPVGARPTKPVELAELVWVSSRSDGTVAVIDPESFEVVETIDVGIDTSGLAVFGELLWVPIPAENVVKAVDPIDRGVVVTLSVGQSPATPAVDGPRMAVPNRGDGTVSIIR